MRPHSASTSPDRLEFLCGLSDVHFLGVTVREGDLPRACTFSEQPEHDTDAEMEVDCAPLPPPDPLLL
uniref:Uncharacterized protein n=1 Tax=Chromera velia CCMP2878 TaxID=1169474 RepID=A0A0G4F6U6_9ALVE|eukprot:Cvel_15498.t1-p1 / transcript=Cvel_15498.t1 / gene=Cvel_15498 / organism=Chromera_velia_CCMP2878 / gene_product=hypothetical protein / transcript_product=hypothetical protein / location=Cvel_scaffold1150:12861-13849(-) / protein_length=67 / sequence_SO=supercontig / SO=protein_coding / is_pseudo=false